MLRPRLRTPPPSNSWIGNLVPVEEDQAADGSDLLRADSTNREPEDALDAIDGSGAVGLTD